MSETDEIKLIKFVLDNPDGRRLVETWFKAYVMRDNLEADKAVEGKRSFVMDICRAINFPINFSEE